MGLRYPPRVPLARLPTPFDPMVRAGARLGLDLRVKRDDLTGNELGGNKVRKLEFLLAEALDRGATAVLTCGALGSNHARATAAASARLGLRPFLLLRGAPPPEGTPPDGNLLLDRLFGATLEFITQAQWADRDALLAAWAERLVRAGERPYVVPEGGSNALGSLGYAVAVEEILGQAEAAGVAVSCVAHACGSAGTAAGIALGLAAAGREDVELLSVAVCDDRAYFDARIAAILDDAVAAGYASSAVRARARWRVVEGWKGRGYALSTPEELLDVARIAREEGVLLDPVYTGKAFRGLAGEAREGRVPSKGASVFVHTGGTFGLFPARDEFPWDRI